MNTQWPVSRGTPHPIPAPPSSSHPLPTLIIRGARSQFDSTIVETDYRSKELNQMVKVKVKSDAAGESGIKWKWNRIKVNSQGQSQS